MSITRRGFLKGLIAGIGAAIVGKGASVAADGDFFYRGGDEPVLLVDGGKDSEPYSVCGDCDASQERQDECYFFCPMRDGPDGSAPSLWGSWDGDAKGTALRIGPDFECPEG